MDKRLGLARRERDLVWHAYRKVQYTAGNKSHVSYYSLCGDMSSHLVGGGNATNRPPAEFRCRKCCTIEQQINLVWQPLPATITTTAAAEMTP